MLKLSFYTNMPTPYQLDFFDELSKLFDLNVIYFSKIEKNRVWKLNHHSVRYKSTFLKDSTVSRLIQKRYESFHFSWKIIKLLFKDDADVLIANGTYWSPNVVLIFFIGFVRRKKVAYYSEAIFKTSNPFARFFKYILLLPVRCFTDCVLGIGQLAVDSFRRYGYQKPIYNIPYNINIDLFRKDILDPNLLQSISKKFSDSGQILFLTSGSLIKRKGIDIIIKAFLRLGDDVNASLLILGDGPEKPYLQQLSGSRRNIHFLGFQEKELVPYFFAVSDIFVCASRYDGWGLIINEALAADLPIISSSEVGAAKDSLQNDLNVLICPSENVDAFTSSMNKLYQDKNLRETLIANSAEVKIALSSRTNAKKLNDIFGNN